MYGENANVKNDYTVDAPRNSKNDFIYYYLSGKVAVKSVEDAQKETTKNLSSGNAGALENYWVCLNKPNVGSNPGIASTPTDPDTYKTHGDVYITLYYELTNTVANVSDIPDVYLYGANRINPTSMSGNTVFFENIPVGEYAIIIGQAGIAPMNPSEPFYTDKKVVVEEDGDYYGCSASKPNSIYLKKLAIGTVKFTETSDYWSVRSSDCTNTPRTTSPTIIDGELKFIDTVKNITRKFSVDSASLSITSSDVAYIPEGDYQMVFTSSNYEEVRQKITATASGFKIDGEIQQELSINLTTKKKFDTSVEIAVTTSVANRVSNGNLFLTLNLGAGEITVPFTASRSEYIDGNAVLHFDINEENISNYINNNVDIAALYGKCIIYVIEGGNSTMMGEIYLYPAKKTKISINGFSLR